MTAALGAVAAVALVPAGAQARSLYVPNRYYNVVTVVDTATNAVSKISLNSSAQAEVAAIAPDGKTVYIVQDASGSSGKSASLAPITVSTGVVGTPIPISGADIPDQIAITPDGSKAYVANLGNGTITPIDLTTGESGTPITVGDSSSYPSATTISPDGKTLYVSDDTTGQVVPVNLATGTAGTPIALNGWAGYSAITPDGKTLWVTDADGLVPIDTATGTPGTAIALPDNSGSLGVSISPDGTMAYVVDEMDGEVDPVNLAERSVGLPIPVGNDPYFIAMTPDGKTAEILDWGSGGMVTPISTATNTPGTAVSVGASPSEAAVVPNQGPTAAFTSSVEGRTASLNGSPSSDSDGSVASYDWNFGDGSRQTTSTAGVTHTYAHPGRHTVTLTVTDNEGCSTSLVFTGQTAYCNGTSAATVSHAAVIARPKASIKTGSARVRSGKAKIKVSCLGVFRCKGTLTLRRGKTKVGSGHYSIAAGKSSKVTVRLGSAGRSKLAAHHRLKTKATATVSGGTKATRTVTLIAG